MNWACSPHGMCVDGYEKQSNLHRKVGKIAPFLAWSMGLLVASLRIALLALGCMGVMAQTSAPPEEAKPAQPWQVQTVAVRTLAGGKVATLALATRVHKTVAPRHVLLFVSPFSSSLLRADQRSAGFSATTPWFTAAAALNAQGVAMAFVDAPNDGEKHPLRARSPVEIANDIQSAVARLAQQFPGIPIHLAGFHTGAGALLDAAGRVKGVQRIALASADLRTNRNSDWSDYAYPVMLLHAPSAQCDTAPYLEAEWAARKNHFALVQVGYSQQEDKPNCGRGSQHIFAGLEAEFASTVAHWLDGAEPPAGIGVPHPSIAWREQLLHYTVPSTFGNNTLEMTLMLPSGEGPFPVAVFNHGDIEIDSTYMRYKTRYVDPLIAREFLSLGWAMAFPARRGVALSEGIYPLKNFLQNDGDATYKARVHAQDILPALEFLKTMPALDTQRMLVMGQSAGGYSTMYIASLNLPGVIGAVNFSGGRTDKTRTDTAGFLNTTMVNGFAEFGKSTHIPMLWVFAENDSRYTANTIRTCYQVFTEAGGRATLSLSPPIDVDGHFVYHKPELWRQALHDYLVELEHIPHAK